MLVKQIKAKTQTREIKNFLMMKSSLKKVKRIVGVPPYRGITPSIPISQALHWFFRPINFSKLSNDRLGVT
jgi:hypothetical protein